MMKNEKGITMIALVLTLVVMAILAGITINTGSKQIKEAELQDLVTNMLLIQAKVKIGIEEVEFKKANLDATNDAEKIKTIKDENLLGTEVSGVDIASVQESLSNIVDNLENWYYLTNDDLKEIGLYELMNINDENQYFLYKYDGNLESNSENIEILYTGGYVHSDKNTYYKLSELEELQKS